MQVFARLHPDRDLFYEAVPENCTANELLKALGLLFLVVCSYLTEVYIDNMAVEQQFIDRIAEVEFSILAGGIFLRTVRSDRVTRLVFAQ